MMNDAGRIDGLLKSAGIVLWGVAGFEAVAPRLIGCSARRRLPERAAAVIVALFPYYSGGHEDGNISKYAMPRDYHIIAGEMLKNAAAALRAAYPACAFEPFCDASPVPEVEAARLAGLGCAGRNGLLISPLYGSYVFIGEIVTDMPLEACRHPGGTCIGCMACERSCPAGALDRGIVNWEKCLSHISQRKGALTAREEEQLKRVGSVWGCDVCQNVCPMNRAAACTPLEAFRKDLVEKITGEELDRPDFSEKYRARAFMWKGEAVLRRNLRIMEGAPENTTAEHAKGSEEGKPAKP